jgi:hypothetical protein
MTANALVVYGFLSVKTPPLPVLPIEVITAAAVNAELQEMLVAK